METKAQREHREKAIREAAYKSMLRSQKRNWLVDRIIELEEQLSDLKKQQKRIQESESK